MAVDWKANTRIDIDPDAKKDYTFDLAAFVPTGVTISSYTIVASVGVTVTDDTRNGTEITFWVSGVAEGATETVTVRVTLSTGLIDDFSLKFRGRHQ
jgi:hypothetical protein